MDTNWHLPETHDEVGCTCTRSDMKFWFISLVECSMSVNRMTMDNILFHFNHIYDFNLIYIYFILLSAGKAQTSKRHQQPG